MPRTRKTKSPATGPFSKSAVETNTIMMNAPFVIGTRLTQMALAGSNPSAKDRRENHQMVAEKILAAQQSAFMFNQAVWKAWMGMPLALMKGMPVAKDMDAITAAALKPYSSKVRANRKRLAKGSK